MDNGGDFAGAAVRMGFATMSKLPSSCRQPDVPPETGSFLIGVLRCRISVGRRSGCEETSNLSDAQKAFILKQGDDGVPVAEICRKAGISQATYFNWRKKYAGLLPDEMRRLKALEDENSRLKKIVADLTLDREMLQDVIRRKL